MAIKNNTARMDITTAIGIHNGEVIHHQLHVMTPVSFKTKNTRNRAPVNPSPEEADEDMYLLDMFILVVD